MFRLLICSVGLSRRTTLSLRIVLASESLIKVNHAVFRTHSSSALWISSVRSPLPYIAVYLFCCYSYLMWFSLVTVEMKV